MKKEYYIYNEIYTDLKKNINKQRLIRLDIIFFLYHKEPFILIYYINIYGINIIKLYFYELKI